MELVLTEKRGGGYQAHRPTCKKMGDKEQFDAEELSFTQVKEATACSSCKPKDEDMAAMLDEDRHEVDEVEVEAGETADSLPQGEPVSESVDDDDWIDDDEDLIGDVAPAPVKPVDPPKVKPVPAPAKTEVKAEEVTTLLNKVFSHLSLRFPEGVVFPGFGKAYKTPDKQTVYLNSKGTADVRASSPEQATAWVEAGLAERRGGNYVRVAVRDL